MPFLWRVLFFLFLLVFSTGWIMSWRNFHPSEIQSLPRTSIHLRSRSRKIIQLKMQSGVKLRKVIMRFLQVGPGTKFSRMAASPGGETLAHAEVCAHDNGGGKEPAWVSGEPGSALSPHSWVAWPWLSQWPLWACNPELQNLENDTYSITRIKFTR